MTPGELTEIGRLFRAKLRYLREQEPGSRQRSPRRSGAPGRGSRIHVIEPAPAADAVLSSGQLAGPLERQPEDGRPMGR